MNDDSLPRARRSGRDDADGTSPPPVERDRSGSPDEVDPVLGITVRDMNVLDAYHHQRALDASEDVTPPGAAEQAELDTLRAHTERLLSMSPDEVIAERQSRRRARGRE